MKPYMKNQVFKKLGSFFKNSDTIMNNAFWVGIYPGISVKNLNKIYDLLFQFTQDIK